MSKRRCEEVNKVLGSRLKVNGYTVHAGRNLLVKDFCYLRTVNVPAAVRSLSGWNIGTKVALDE